MGGSFHIATISGIPLKIHWSFGLLLLWVAYKKSEEGFDLITILSAFIMVLSVFVCVILHEFGHAFAARQFGVKTFDIIMMPIGGIARLERMPEGKGQEFWVAIAGPIVNFLIAGIIWLGFVVFSIKLLPSFSGLSWNLYAPLKDYFIIILLSNFLLGVFNLIPAFPMDGGRILRSLLSLQMDRGKATQIASYIGQFIAVIMFCLGLLYRQPIWTLIGLFIFLAARQENKMMQRQARLTKTKAADIMEPLHFHFYSGQPLSQANELVKNLEGDSFIVWSRPGIPAGYITREILDSFNPLSQPETSIDTYVIATPAVVAPETPAGHLYAFMQHHKIPLALVFNQQQYLGVVPWKKISQLVNN